MHLCTHSHKRIPEPLFPLPSQCSWQRLVQNATQLSPHFLSRKINSCRHPQKKEKVERRRAREAEGVCVWRGVGRLRRSHSEIPSRGKQRHRPRSTQGPEPASPWAPGRCKATRSRARRGRPDPTPSPSAGAGGAARSPSRSALAASEAPGARASVNQRPRREGPGTARVLRSGSAASLA